MHAATPWFLNYFSPELSVTKILSTILNIDDKNLDFVISGYVHCVAMDVVCAQGKIPSTIHIWINDSAAGNLFMNSVWKNRAKFSLDLGQIISVSKSRSISFIHEPNVYEARTTQLQDRFERSAEKRIGRRLGTLKWFLGYEGDVFLTWLWSNQYPWLSRLKNIMHQTGSTHLL